MRFPSAGSHGQAYYPRIRAYRDEWRPGSLRGSKRRSRPRWERVPRSGARDARLIGLAHAHARLPPGGDPWYDTSRRCALGVAVHPASPGTHGVRQRWACPGWRWGDRVGRRGRARPALRSGAARACPAQRGAPGVRPSRHASRPGLSGRAALQLLPWCASPPWGSKDGALTPCGRRGRASARESTRRAGARAAGCPWATARLRGFGPRGLPGSSGAAGTGARASSLTSRRAWARPPSPPARG
jgi:hypothetical protein